MDISQLNSKTVYLKKAGVEFLIQYFYIWNGIKKEPESVILKTNSIDAFFLTSVIKDAITETEEGFTVQRRWNIVPGGNLQLSFCLDIVIPSQIPFLVPCLVAGEQLPPGNFTVLGERLTYPSSVFLFPEDRGIFLYSDLPEAKDEFSSLHVSRARMDRYHCVRTEVCRPPYERFPEDFSERAGFQAGPAESTFQSPGHLEQSLTVHVLLSKGREIFPVALNYVHKKQPELTRRSARKDPRELTTGLKKKIGYCLENLLVADRGVYGVKDAARESSLCIESTAGLALLMQMIYKAKVDVHEQSLCLADFCLKAQHPTGLFLEKYFLRTGQWFSAGNLKALKNGEQAGGELRLPHTADVASCLLLLSEELKDKDYCYNSYFYAARECLDFFFENGTKFITPGTTINLVNLKFEAPSLHCLTLIFPLWRLYRLTGDTKYRDAILSLKKKFFPESIPYFKLSAHAPGSRPDFETALLLLRAANVFAELGVELEEPSALINNILPWIYYNKGRNTGDIDVRGAILDSFDSCRLTSRGFELGYELLKFRGVCTEGELVRTIEYAAGDVIAYALRAMPGRPYLYHTLWRPETGKMKSRETAEFSCRSFVRESRYLLYLVRDYADFLVV